MRWLNVVTAYLGAVASGDVRAVKQLVAEDVKYKDNIMELNGIDELLTIVGPDYKMQVQNWAYKNKLVCILEKANRSKGSTSLVCKFKI